MLKQIYGNVTYANNSAMNPANVSVGPFHVIFHVPSD